MTLELIKKSNVEDPIQVIVKQIRGGTWTKVPNVDLLQFVTKPTEDVYNIDLNKSLQVRDKSIDRKFVNRQVQKVNNTGDASGLQAPVLVYFPEEVVYEDTTFLADSYALLDRNHGVLIHVTCGITTADCYVVCFDKDLDSRLTNIRALGNSLNLVWEEKQSTDGEDLKTEYHELMDERIAQGLSPQLSTEENAIFLKRYPFLNQTTLKNYVGNHETGGRKRPAWVPTDIEQTICVSKYEKLYSDYIIMSPRTVASWSGEASGTAIHQSLNNENPDRDEDKLVFIFFAKTKNQAKKSNQDKISNKLKGPWAKKCNFKDVVVIFMGNNKDRVI
jgi:hypothetical protein